jgi:hypothetical protein
VRPRELIAPTGARFGRLTVLGEGRPAGARGVRTWACRCDCGTEKDVGLSDLRKGHTNSCGCLHKDIVRELMTRRHQSEGARP